MCRSDKDKCGARRCKSREEERVAKATWRASKRLKEEFSDSVSPKAPPSEPLNTTLIEGPLEDKVEELRERINKPRGWRSEAEYDQELASAYVELGALIHEAAGPAASETFDAAVQQKYRESASRLESIKNMRSRIDQIDTQLDKIWEEVDNSHNINRETYPIITERIDALKEQVPATGAVYAELKEEQLNLFDKYSTAIRENTALLTENPVLREAILDRRQAYIDALSSVGVQFTDAETKIQVKEGGNKKGEDHLNAVAHMFPKAWVDASNSSEATFTVEATSNRGRYSVKGQSVSQDVIMSGYISYLDDDWKPEEHEKHLFVAFNLQEHYDPELSKVVYQDGEDTYYFDPPSSFENTQAWFRPKYTVFVGRNKAGMPTYTPEDTTGWEQTQTVQNVMNFKTGEREDKVISRWHKRVPLKQQPEVSGDHSMLISKAVNEHGLNGLDQTAAHEFCHRVEHLFPDVVEAEKAFLYHRAKLHTEAPERTTEIQPNEIGYKDNFTHHYSGRIYQGARNYELLSTGIEKLFFGAEDGYAGLQEHQKDDEYRNFILGVLASAGTR